MWPRIMINNRLKREHKNSFLHWTIQNSLFECFRVDRFNSREETAEKLEFRQDIKVRDHCLELLLYNLKLRKTFRAYTSLEIMPQQMF